MINCQHCGTKLLKNAKFCHACGEAVILQLEACRVCNTLNVGTAAFCVGCGVALRNSDEAAQQAEQQRADAKKQQEKAKKMETPVADFVYTPIFLLPLGDSAAMQESLKNYFFQALRTTVKEIASEKKYSEYIQIFYDSKFNYYYEQRQQELTKQLLELNASQPENLDYQVDLLIDSTFEALLDRFTTTHTTALNDWQPPNVLRWEFVKKEDLQLEKMIFDYLDLPPDDDKIFTNFLTMPVPKLRNAWKSFLFAEQSEVPLLISDQTVFGSCKEGFALTNKAIYWKAYFNKPQRFYFQELVDVRKVEDWITINGAYFHVNTKINFKMLKLLKKLRTLFNASATKD